MWRGRKSLAPFLPVHVPGALLSLGDVHFAQGDGEVCGTGIEIESAVTVRLGLRKAPRWVPRFPAYLTPARPERACFATTGIRSRSAIVPCPARIRRTRPAIQPVPSRHGEHCPHDSWAKKCAIEYATSGIEIV